MLAIFLNQLFIRTGKSLQIYHGAEPVDLLIYDQKEDTVLLAEIKAAPLLTPALATNVDRLTTLLDGEVVDVIKHEAESIPVLSSSNLFMFLPTLQQNAEQYRLINLGKIKVEDKKGAKSWAYERLKTLLASDDTLFKDFSTFWLAAFNSYRTRNVSPTYWFTNACGQPLPRPAHWPVRKEGEGGYESVSDSKTSVGMDRTDDIKKGIYQVLKLGADSKPKEKNFKLKTALVSNIYAVRHYNEYLTSLQDIVWTIDETKSAKRVSDLPPTNEIYNLFDGILSFTGNYIRDSWLVQIFQFEEAQ